MFISSKLESEKIFKMRRNEHQELQTLINLKDCVITEIRVDEDCYGPCDTCDQDAKYYKSVSFTTSDFGYLEINLKKPESKTLKEKQDVENRKELNSLLDKE